jgi:hypothetical protein
MKKIDCNTTHAQLEDLFLEPEAVSAEVRSHLAGCAGCSEELASLHRTMDLLDGWQAPEPNPYFLTRMEARLREERAAEPRGWLARQVARLQAGFGGGTQMHTRPLAAMSLTVMLLVGGGVYLDLSDWNQTTRPETQTAVVGDLQTMDSNAQLLDRLESLSNEDGN